MYIKTTDVYRAAGLTSEVISGLDVTENIKDAEQEVDRITNTTFFPVDDSGTATSGGATTIVNTAAGFTVDAHIGSCVYIYSGTGSGQAREITDNDTTTLTVSPAWTTNPAAGSKYFISYLNKVTEIVDGNNLPHLYLKNFPVVCIESITLDGVALAATDYYLYQSEGVVRLATGGTASYFTATEPQNVEVTYHYGVLPEKKHREFDIPRDIKRLTANIAALKTLVQQMGGTYDQLSSFTLPNLTATVGQQYINIEGTVARLYLESDKLQQKCIGKYTYIG